MPKELPVTVNKRLSREEHIVGMFPPGLREKQDKKSKQRKVTVQKIIKQKEEAPARFKVTEELDNNHVRSYESPDIPADGRYVLLIKQQDSIVLFPLRQKLCFKMTFTGNPATAALKDEELEIAIKNTNDLMKNRKIKVKPPKKGIVDPAEANAGKASKIKNEEDDDEESKSNSLKDLVNDQSSGEFDEEANDMFEAFKPQVVVDEKKIEDPLKAAEAKLKEVENFDDGGSADYSADGAGDEDHYY